MSSPIQYEVHGSIALITLNSPPVNGLGLELRQGLTAAIGHASSDPTAQAIVVIGSDRAFSGGADVREFNTPRATQQPQLRTVIRTIEDCSKPVIAAISGACMGGGLELALGCHYRIATPDASLAFPEVKLALMPGAGGTQRLPRLVNLERAITMVTTGATVLAKDLAGTALVDDIVSGELRGAAIAFANKVVKERRPLKRARDIEVDAAGADAIIAAARERHAATSKYLPAPLRCLEALAAAIAKPFDDGMRIEREHFEWLVTTPQSRALRHIFFAERAVGKIPGVAADVIPRAIEQVGVIGAGTMGSGIAMNFLNAKMPLQLLETSQEALSRGVATIRKHYESSLKRGKLTQADLDGRLALLRPTLSYDDLRDCDLLIEAVFESMDVKQQVFSQLDAIAKPGAILASNTSTLDLNVIAASTQRPQDVIGLHFFSPAHVMRLLEVVRGEKTAADVLASGMQLAKRIKKVAVVAGVCDGFIGNRMLHKYQAVAEELLVQGASPQQVDQALEAFGMAMGPFQVGDLAGLDIGWAIRKHRAKMNPALAAPRIADRLCEAGRFGQKTGTGWYQYQAGAREPIPDATTAEIIDAFRRELGVTPRTVSDDEIVAKCIYTLVNEGARILEEGIAYRASDIDIVWLNGYGFPQHRGGPMHYANEVGLPQVVQSLQDFAAADPQHGGRWTPAVLLAQLAAQGKAFT
jgi:3-hydroxyacyl-CoA dehydrogenase